MLVLGMVFTFLMGLIVFALYVIFSLGLYTMAVKRGIANPWLAWIPIADLYIIALILKSLNVFGFEIPMFTVVYPVAAIVVSLLNRVPFIGWLLSLAYFILSLCALNKLYRMYSPANATLFTILSVFGLPVPIIMYMIRNNQPIEVQ